MITADLPPFTKPGQAIDVTVSTVGGATSQRRNFADGSATWG